MFSKQTYPKNLIKKKKNIYIYIYDNRLKKNKK